MNVIGGATNVSVYFYIVEDVGGTNPGEPKTGLVHTNLTSASYARQGAVRSAITPITLASASAAHADGGFILVDDTNMPGVYRFDIPDAAVAAGADMASIAVLVAGASNAVAAPLAVYILDNLVDGVWDEVLTGGTHNIANSSGRRLRFLQESGQYQGAIWIDTVNGTAGTTDFENGTDTNPVSTIADANTLAASLGISRFKVAPGSTITLAATQANQIFEGSSWTLALGSQNIDGSTFIGATVSGIATNTSDSQFFIGCIMGAVTLPADTHVTNSGLTGTHTIGEAGDYFFNGCWSAIAGTGSIIIDFGSALNASNLNVRHHSGGWTVENMGAGTGTYNASFEGFGQITWAVSCSATSNASIRGAWKITDNAGGAVTVTLDDTTTSVTAIEVDTDTTIPGLIAALNDLSITDVLTTQMTEAYAADGAAPTIAQALMMIQQLLGEFAISGTTLTLKKVDGIATAATFTLDDGTNPTSLTRAT